MSHMCMSSSACPRGVPFMMCLANPCEGSSCPANPKAKCRANSCGQCTPQFFDDNDNLVDCAASKCLCLSANVKKPARKETIITFVQFCRHIPIENKAIVLNHISKRIEFRQKHSAVGHVFNFLLCLQNEVKHI